MLAMFCRNLSSLHFDIDVFITIYDFGVSTSWFLRGNRFLHWWLPLFADVEAIHWNPSSISKHVDPCGQAPSLHDVTTPSHKDPVNSIGHTQRKGLSEMHVPPLSHGLLSHSSISASKWQLVSIPLRDSLLKDNLAIKKRCCGKGNLEQCPFLRDCLFPRESIIGGSTLQCHLTSKISNTYGSRGVHYFPVHFCICGGLVAHLQSICLRKLLQKTCSYMVIGGYHNAHVMW